MITSKQRMHLRKLRIQLLQRADQIVLDGGRLLANDPLVRRIASISRMLKR